MTNDRMFALAQALAVAKSRQDIPTALTLLHPDMVLENPAFGSRAQGLAENEAALARFFRSFPDYDVELQVASFEVWLDGKLVFGLDDWLPSA